MKTLIDWLNDWPIIGVIIIMLLISTVDSLTNLVLKLFGL